jgi:hypothetical protein
VVDIVAAVVDIVVVVVAVEASWEICHAGSSELRDLQGSPVDETATIPSFDRTCPWKYHNWLDSRRWRRSAGRGMRRCLA